MSEIQARVIVAIEFVNGGLAQAACRTEGCAAGDDDGPWRGGTYSMRSLAQAGQEANWHRIGHRTGWVATRA